MRIEEIRGWGAKIADWAARYLSTVHERPVRSPQAPGATLKALPAAPPERGEDMEAIFADFEKIIVPGLTHWQHPRHFAYFPCNSSPPSVLAEYLTASLGVQCMLWQTSPAATELEMRVMDWLRQMLGLPEEFQGVIHDTASSATLSALLTAREKALNWRGNGQGLSGQPAVRVYCSEQAHSSIDKACWIAGIGQDNLIKLPSSGSLYGMDVAALDRAIVADRAAGHLPSAIVASVGATSVGACDGVRAICEIARRHNIHIHVDAAWAGSAMICPEFRELWDGVQLADSVVFNPHKWLLTNFDCTAFFVRDPAALVKTLGIRPEYLKTQGRDGIINYSEWSLQLGRRFRALKLWFVIRAYGLENLRNLVRDHVRWAQGLAERIKATADFELVTPPILSLFSFRYKPEGTADLDALNARLIQAINDDGRTYLTQTRFQDQFVIRFVVGQTYTTERDVTFAWEVIQEIARNIK
ncbi:pyridoxal phosphate-dependent decarboxylase family protein [Dongia deserti]|uniref:pyridoxal phosphate-dependent decarboxylase family protein n=1 Tax=Dongia deserti TaxID=2268030 RepID=UPI000E65A4A6|nr:pyridoxal-dependent decarboxylase [Dongia deserti]